VRQSSQYEIQPNFDASKSTNCWDKICSDLDVGPKGYKPTIQNAMRLILEFAKQRTKADVGHEIFKNCEVATPTLIISSDSQDQNYHLDIMGKEQRQYGMIISNRSTSTVVCDLTDKDFKVKTPDDFTYVLKESIKLEGKDASWMMPSDELISSINEQEEGSFLYQKLKEGFGDLLRITKSSNTPIKDVPPKLRWSSAKV